MGINYGGYFPWEKPDRPKVPIVPAAKLHCLLKLLLVHGLLYFLSLGHREGREHTPQSQGNLHVTHWTREHQVEDPPFQYVGLLRGL